MINIVHVLIASVLYFIGGAVWYSPLMFGTKWQKLVGFSDKKMKKDGEDKSKMALLMGSAFLQGFFTVTILNFILRELAIDSFRDTLFLITLIWLAFVYLPSLVTSLFQEKSKMLLNIDKGKDLFGMVLAGIVFYFI